MSSVHDVHSDATCKRDLSYQFQYNNGRSVSIDEQSHIINMALIVVFDGESACKACVYHIIP